MRRLLAIALFATLAGCHGDKSTAPQNVSIVGSWVGNTSGQILSMTLAENNGVVTGSGTITGTSMGTAALNISGTYAAAPIGHLNVTLSAGSAQPFNLAAQVYPTSMLGTLTGSGFTGDVLTLNRQ